MHALVAARLGDSEMALRYLHETADTDLASTRAPPAACASPGSAHSGRR